MNEPVASKAEVIERLQQSREHLASLGVEGLGLFGSLVTGRDTPDSDVDILVGFVADRHTFDNFMDLSFFLEDLLGRRVELVTPDSLSPHIGPHILREVERVPIAA
jgi:predicted nucleotidyltransferase